MREAAIFVCFHVFENSKPINLVVFTEGDLQALCGGEHDPNEVPRVIGLEHFDCTAMLVFNMLLAGKFSETPAASYLNILEHLVRVVPRR